MSLTYDQGEVDELLRKFWRELVDLREELGTPSVRKMVLNCRHATGTSGNKNSFAELARGPLTDSPRPDLLRGFLIGIKAPEVEIITWEAKRRDLVKELRRIQSGGSIPAMAEHGERAAPANSSLTGAVVEHRVWRRNRRSLVTVGVTMVIVTLYSVWGTHWLGGGAATSNLVGVSGHVQCTSGAPVVGVYVETGTSVQGFASFDAAQSRSVASFAYSVPSDHPYSVHVGCGGTPSAWATDNRSDDVMGAVHSLVCADGQAVAEHSHYGVCRDQ